jgi:hypothetical protein
MTFPHPNSNDAARARLPVDLMAGRRLADVPVSTTAIAREPADGVSCRLGDASCAAAHAARLDRSTATDTLLRLQRQFGNRYVGRVLARAREVSPDGPAHGADDHLAVVERTIDQARGTGQDLDHRTRGHMETAFGADFGGVRIHTDTRADGLNHALSARAFATGQDVFFRQGEYDPGSSRGRELLAHELTHVVQQTGTGAGPQAKMTVSEPDDPQEREADEMARSVVAREHAPPDVRDVHEESQREKKEKREEQEERSSAVAPSAAPMATLSRKSESVVLPDWGSKNSEHSNMQIDSSARLFIDGVLVKEDFGLSSTNPVNFKVPKCAKTGEVQIIARGTWYRANVLFSDSGSGNATIQSPFTVNEKGELHFMQATPPSSLIIGNAAQMSVNGSSADFPPRGGSLTAQAAIVANNQEGVEKSVSVSVEPPPIPLPLPITVGGSVGIAKTSSFGSGNSFVRGYRVDLSMEKKEPIPKSVAQSVFFQVGKHQVVGSKDKRQNMNIADIYKFVNTLREDVRKEIEDGTGERNARIELLTKASVTTPPHPGAGSNLELTEKRRDAVLRVLQDFLGGGAKIKAKAVGEIEASDPGESDAERVAVIKVSWSDDPCETGPSQPEGKK